MKKTILLSFTIISSFFGIAQDIDRFKKNDSITMFGVDYSQTYFVGKEGFTNPYAIESQFFNKWNNLFLMEQEKYSISKALKKSAVYYSIEYITSVNDNVTTEEIKSRIVNSVYQKDLLSLEEEKK